jgi:hypothetical protein
MDKVTSIFSLVISAVIVYLFIANGDKTVSIINSLGSWSNAGIKTLQGR